jgi:hypothetical protein
MQTRCRFWQVFLIFWCLTAIHDLHAQVPSLFSPMHVHGHQVANRFATQTDLVNVITWHPPSGGITPFAYKIYRKSNLTELVATIPANGKLQFKDHQRQPHHFYTYFLVSVDAAGTQSTPIGIFFNGSKVRVKKNFLVSIVVTPVDPKIAKDFTVQFTAMGIFSNNTTRDLTNEVKWTSSQKRIASISNTPGRKGLATGLSPGTTQIAASLHEISGSTTLTVTTATLVAIEVTPVNTIVARDFTIQFTAMGIFSDGTTENLTKEVMWSSSTPIVATISNTPGSQGLATGISAGVTQIVATFNGLSASEHSHSSSSSHSNSRVPQIVSGSTTLRVTAATLVAIEVTPVDPIVAVGFNIAFTAIGIFSDSTTENLTNEVTWSSLDPTVAFISNIPGSQGLATGISAGFTQIMATVQGLSGSTTLRVTSGTLVSIEVNPIDSTVPIGFTAQFTATGTFSDGTIKNLTTEVTWESSNPTVAEISNAAGSQGLATGLTTGSTTISAIDAATGVIGTTTLTVTPATLVAIEVMPIDPVIALGLNVQFTATAIFSDHTTKDVTEEVTWSSSDPTVASISNTPGSQGLAVTVGPGFTLIAATLDGVVSSTTLTVTEATLVLITVTPVAPTVAVGFTVQFTATGTFSDGTTEDLTTEVTWESSNIAVAMISNATGSQGLATALETGSTTITAIDPATSIAGSTTLTVTPIILVSIALTPVDPSIAKGFTIQFTATGTFSDGSTENLTTAVSWSSSNTAVAQISNAVGSQGLATSLNVGSTTITAFDATKQISGSTTLTVTSALLVSIAVTPVDPTLTAGSPFQFTATGTFSDGSTENLTTIVTWSSSNTAIAQISNATGSQGVATGLTQGMLTITAIDAATLVSGSTMLTVTCPDIVITSTSPLPNGIAGARYSFQFTSSGGVPPVTWILLGDEADIPSELTFSSSGLLSGNLLPNLFQMKTFSVRATSSCGKTVTGTFTITVTPPI